MKSHPVQPPQDTPFTVQRYVTDPKLVGYQILTNYESMYWAPLVGNDAWRLYEVLRSFCHEGNSACYPSIRLLTAVLGLKEKRVLTGWSKTVGGKEYRYVGLIEILQQYELAIAEVQGEGPKMRYIFHVNLTPSLLTEEHLHKLPDLLQKKHGDLLERCEHMKRELQSKKRPSKFSETSEPGENESPLEGGGKLPPWGGNLPGGGGKLPPKQHQYNNTHKTASNMSDVINNNSGDENLPKLDVVVALASLGISEKVALRLSSRYSEERIKEKIEYVQYLLDAEKVEAPAGWLRKAIEDNYAKPDGFVSSHEREEAAQHEREENARREVAAQKAQEEKAKEEEETRQKKQAFLNGVRKKYETTVQDIQFGENLKQELKAAQYSHIYLVAMEFLKLTDDKIIIGITNKFVLDQMTHASGRMPIQRCLKLMTKKNYEVEFVFLEQVGGIL